MTDIRAWKGTQTVQCLFLWLYLTAETERRTLDEPRMLFWHVSMQGIQGTMRKKPGSWTLGFICVVQAGGSLGGVGMSEVLLAELWEGECGMRDGVFDQPWEGRIDDGGKTPTHTLDLYCSLAITSTSLPPPPAPSPSQLCFTL